MVRYLVLASIQLSRMLVKDHVLGLALKKNLSRIYIFLKRISGQEHICVLKHSEIFSGILLAFKFTFSPEVSFGIELSRELFEHSVSSTSTFFENVHWH